MRPPITVVWRGRRAPRYAAVSPRPLPVGTVRKSEADPAPRGAPRRPPPTTPAPKEAD